MGRKRKATAVKDAEGAYKKNPQRRNKNEPKAVEGRPDMPSVVQGNELAEAKWHHLCKMMEQLGVLSQTDSDLMAAYSVTWADWVELRVLVKKEGHSIVGGMGGMVVNPNAREMTTALKTLMKLAPEFGLTPASRSLLSAVPDDSDDLLKQFIGLGTRLNN